MAAPQRHRVRLPHRVGEAAASSIGRTEPPASSYRSAAGRSGAHRPDGASAWIVGPASRAGRSPRRYRRSECSGAGPGHAHASGYSLVLTFREGIAAAVKSLSFSPAIPSSVSKTGVVTPMSRMRVLNLLLLFLFWSVL